MGTTMPENREDETTRQLLIELSGRVQSLDEAIRSLTRTFSGRPWAYVRLGEGPEQVFYPLFHLPPLQDEQIRSQGGTHPMAVQEWPAPPWQHLVMRRHPWRRQLYVKGRNMTVRQLVGTIKANQLTVAEAAEDLGLPVEAINEALAYAEKHKDLLESDAAYERHLLAQGDHGRGASSVPR
jgi:uncharacterized protein (DUF433 family)